MALAVAVLFVGIYWWISDSGGAVGIPRADDWSYILSAFALHDQGEIVLNNWAGMMLIGHLALAQPVIELFGESILALQAYVAALAIIALLLLYVVVRQAITPRLSALSVTLLAVSPIFAPTAVGFMTDIPALLLMTASLGIGSLSLQSQRPSWVLLTISVILGIGAFTIREFTIMSTIAVLFATFCIFPSIRTRVTVFIFGGGVLFLTTILFLWRNSLPNAFVLQGWDFGSSVQFVAQGALTLGFLVSPLLLALDWRKVFASIGRFRYWYAGKSIIASLLIWWVADGTFLGNIFHPFGSTWLLQGTGIPLWSISINRILMSMAVLSLALTVFLLASWIRVAVSRKPHLLARMPIAMRLPNHRALFLFTVFTVLLLGVHVFASLGRGAWLIDRYLILVLPFLAASLLGCALLSGWLIRRSFFWAPFVGLGILFILTVHITDFTARFDGSRWSMGHFLVSQGYAPQEIDAGMQWVSYHARTVGINSPTGASGIDEPWWTERYPNQQFCVTVIGVAGSDVSPPQVPTLSSTTLFQRHFRLEAHPGPDRCQ